MKKIFLISLLFIVGCASEDINFNYKKVKTLSLSEVNYVSIESYNGTMFFEVPKTKIVLIASSEDDSVFKKGYCKIKNIKYFRSSIGYNVNDCYEMLLSYKDTTFSIKTGVYSDDEILFKSFRVNDSVYTIW